MSKTEDQSSEHAIEGIPAAEIVWENFLDAPELRCGECNEFLGTLEHGDSLIGLVGLALEHAPHCTGPQVHHG